MYDKQSGVKAILERGVSPMCSRKCRDGANDVLGVMKLTSQVPKLEASNQLNHNGGYGFSHSIAKIAAT